MVKALNDDDDAALGADCDPGLEPDAPLSDNALLDLLDGLVAARGRVPAARVLGVNYRTLAICWRHPAGLPAHAAGAGGVSGHRRRCFC